MLNQAAMAIIGGRHFPRTWSDDFSSGVLSPRYQTGGGTWSIVDVGGGVLRLVNTPGLGAEKLANPSFDVNTTNWTSAATLASVAGGQANNCLRITAVAANSTVNSEQAAYVAGSWYRQRIYMKLGDFTPSACNFSIYDGTNELSRGAFVPTADWVEYAHIFRAILTGNARMYVYANGAVAGQVIYFDEASIKPITSSSLFIALRMASPRVLASVGVTRGAGLRGGVIACLDSPTIPTNFLIAYLDGAGSCKLDKCVAGVYTNVLSGAVTYVAGTAVILDASALPTVVLKYGAATVGSGTVSDAGVINNRYHGAFSTGSGYSEVNLSSLSLVCS